MHNKRGFRIALPNFLKASGLQLQEFSAFE